ncbi:uncharacterized protein LOC116915927 isoform X3 [Daphnia magna]|uniref:uncharacterized protein LOC116915927 isoform X3 n=1 Tax=Daphnia magna TaxID=35525 RepID=UPI001E1BC799|nr:uncharacterized protein LOC116915927 isoform X3 [Daphnia magna]
MTRLPIICVPTAEKTSIPENEETAIPVTAETSTPGTEVNSTPVTGETAITATEENSISVVEETPLPVPDETATPEREETSIPKIEQDVIPTTEVDNDESKEPELVPDPEDPAFKELRQLLDDFHPVWKRSTEMANATYGVVVFFVQGSECRSHSLFDRFCHNAGWDVGCFTFLECIRLPGFVLPLCFSRNFGSIECRKLPMG